jgi:hypothetical protein
MKFGKVNAQQMSHSMTLSRRVFTNEPTNVTNRIWTAYGIP